MSWKQVTVGEIASVITKGTTPTTYGMPFVESGINFIRAEALNGNSSLDHNGFVFIDINTHEKLVRSQLQEKDVLVTIAGANVGKCGFVRQADLPANTNQAVGIIRVKESIADPRFIYYHFKLPSTQKLCLSIGGQSAQPNVNLANLKAFKLFLPDISMQSQIADILSAYDDLIENNRRRMALLEDAARMIYREWFVRLRFPGYETTRIVDGVPEGWEKRRLGDVISLKYGKALRDADRRGGMIPVYGSSGVVGFHDTALTKSPGIIVGRKGNAGSVFWSDNDFWPIDTTYYISTEESDYFVYHNLQNQPFINSDVAVPGLNRDYAHSMSLISPDAYTKGCFNEVVTPMYEQVWKLREMNQKLQQARDILLPKLMSGEIDVSKTVSTLDKELVTV